MREKVPFRDTSVMNGTFQESNSDLRRTLCFVELDTSDTSADSMQQVLTEGEDRNLYRLRSWMVARGEARALLIPAAPLKEIADTLWNPVAPPAATRWIAGQRKCAALTREIETAPVEFGLANLARRMAVFQARFRISLRFTPNVRRLFPYLL